MRPLVANLAICIPSATEEKPPRSWLLRQFTMEIGKILGISPTLFQYYHNAETQKAYGVSESQLLPCVDGTEQVMELPNVLQLRDGPYYEVVTPTVVQIVRNHFDCQILTGARLERGEGSITCFGSHWDERFFFGEDITPFDQQVDDTTQLMETIRLSPLTLALLEDSSWYKADYTNTKIPSFGHGAGCGFVLDDCLLPGTGELPNYSQGFFCNNSPSLSFLDVNEDNFDDAEQPLLSCDYSHSFKASCDIINPFQEQHTSTDFIGSPFPDVQYCPMVSKNPISCMNDLEQDNPTIFPGEVYGPHSKCIETTSKAALCLRSHCNVEKMRLEIWIDDRMYACEHDGQIIEVTEDYSLKCPRIAAICPNIICPSNCSGKGVCDYCLEIPQCICDNPLDESLGCWG